MYLCHMHVRIITVIDYISNIPLEKILYDITEANRKFILGETTLVPSLGNFWFWEKTFINDRIHFKFEYVDSRSALFLKPKLIKGSWYPMKKQPSKNR